MSSLHAFEQQQHQRRPLSPPPSPSPQPPPPSTCDLDHGASQQQQHSPLLALPPELITLILSHASSLRDLVACSQTSLALRVLCSNEHTSPWSAPLERELRRAREHALAYAPRRRKRRASVLREGEAEARAAMREGGEVEVLETEDDSDDTDDVSSSGSHHPSDEDDDVNGSEAPAIFRRQARLVRSRQTLETLACRAPYSIPPRDWVTRFLVLATRELVLWRAELPRLNEAHWAHASDERFPPSVIASARTRLDSPARASERKVFLRTLATLEHRKEDYCTSGPAMVHYLLGHRNGRLMRNRIAYRQFNLRAVYAEMRLQNSLPVSGLQARHLPLRLAWADVSIYFLYCRGAHPLLARHNAEMTELLKALGVHGGEQDFYVQGPIMMVGYLRRAYDVSESDLEPLGDTSSGAAAAAAHDNGVSPFSDAQVPAELVRAQPLAHECVPLEPGDLFAVCRKAGVPKHWLEQLQIVDHDGFR